MLLVSLMYHVATYGFYVCHRGKVAVATEREKKAELQRVSDLATKMAVDELNAVEIKEFQEKIKEKKKSVKAKTPTKQYAFFQCSSACLRGV